MRRLCSPLTYASVSIIVSIPVDLSGPDDAALAALEEKGVKGRYVSVERLTELPDGAVRWEMATSSTPGGNIPSFVSEMSMPGKISEVRTPSRFRTSLLTMRCAGRAPLFRLPAREPDAADGDADACSDRHRD
jgi:hypothetical protein